METGLLRSRPEPMSPLEQTWGSNCHRSRLKQVTSTEADTRQQQSKYEGASTEGSGHSQRPLHSRPELVTSTVAGLSKWPLLEQVQGNDLSESSPKKATSMRVGPKDPQWCQAISRNTKYLQGNWNLGSDCTLGETVWALDPLALGRLITRVTESLNYTN